MDKLIITVTCDSTMAYPSNPHNPTPKGHEEVAKEYVRSWKSIAESLPSWESRSKQNVSITAAFGTPNGWLKKG